MPDWCRNQTFRTDDQEDAVVRQPKRRESRPPPLLPKQYISQKELPLDDDDKDWAGVFPFNPTNVFRKMPEDNQRVSVADDFDEESDQDIDELVGDTLDRLDVSVKAKISFFHWCEDLQSKPEINARDPYKANYRKPKPKDNG